MPPRRYCSAQALQRRAEAGPRQLLRGVGRPGARITALGSSARPEWCPTRSARGRRPATSMRLEFVVTGRKNHAQRALLVRRSHGWAVGFTTKIVAVALACGFAASVCAKLVNRYRA